MQPEQGITDHLLRHICRVSAKARGTRIEGVSGKEASTPMPVLSGRAKRSARMAAADAVPGACTVSELPMLPDAPDRGRTSEICLQGGQTHEACSAF